MKKVGRYDIISELGRGAMGIVYKASDPTIDREVALKVLSLTSTPEDGTNSPQQMFMREVRAAGRLAHHSIVTIYDAFEDAENQTSCIVMELVPGVTLEHILDSGHTLTADQTFSIVRQVAEGLDYAHRNNVIHRDLKPANILVTEDGRAKITDFGIAKILAREGVARTIGVMGTPSYMSPEQVKGGEVDARTDIFSLGIIIFSMLTGKKPFAGNTAAVMFKIVYEDPAVPSSINFELTPAHNYLIKRCLAKDRNQRYASARELLGDLEDLQYGRPLRTQAHPGSSTVAPEASPSLGGAMPISGLMKAPSRQAPPHSTPPAPPFVPPPAPPVEGRSPQPPSPLSHTKAMPISELMKAASQPPAPHSTPPAPILHTAGMPISELMKAASRQPSPHSTPPEPPFVPPPVPPVEGRSPQAPSPTSHTVAMPVSELMKAASQQPPARSMPPAPPAPPRPRSPLEMGAPVTPSEPPSTMAMPISELMKAASQAPSQPVVPKPPAPLPQAQKGVRLTGQTLPMRLPDLSAAGPATAESQYVPPQASVHDEPTLRLERTFPTQAPDHPAMPPAAGLPFPPARPPEAVATPTVEFAYDSTAALPAPKSKLIPALLGGVAVIVLAAAGLGYWKFHKRAAPPPQVAVQSQPATPPPVPIPAESSTPPSATPAEPPPLPVSAAPGTSKNAAIRKSKQLAAKHPSEPVPAPAPPPPAPVIAAPPPKPVPAAPSPEAIAKAEAARLASIPRIVQVSCNYGLKEATFTFSAGGQSLFEETLKGKKKKGGFLGIKGSYEGTFSHTITVPAGASQVSVHVVSKDGTDLTQTIKMPTSGGFVPTLTVQVDSDHMSLNWKNSPAAQ
ncbi:MAG: protein kinase [Acidobacteriota bacterium]|nr:protein kinase [Acidobacteriota bacterium]